MHKYIIIPIIALLLAGAWIFTGRIQAQCDGEPPTEGDDTITCDGANQPEGDVIGADGNDTIIIQEGVEMPEEAVISGDFIEGDGTGNDTIINNGEVDAIAGDSSLGAGTGDDSITNNGSAVSIVGDARFGDSSGDDQITNNGTVDYIRGDSNTGGEASGDDVITNNGTVGVTISGDIWEGYGTGDDTITNNGTVEGDIYGDSPNNAAQDVGSDTITNNGTVNGNIDAGGGNASDSVTNNGAVSGNVSTGGGNDSVTNSGTVNGGIDTGDGDDSVVLANLGEVQGVVDGGAGFDSLEFDITSPDEVQLREWAREIAAANPSGGTLTFNDVSYTWTNFEELVELLRLQALNSVAAPMQGFCRSSGNFDIYRITSAEEGELAFRVTPQQIVNALDDITQNTLIDGDGDLQLWALTSGELQMNGPDNYEFRFFYEATCGELPDVVAPPPVIAEEEDAEQFIIINRPAN